MTRAAFGLRGHNPDVLTCIANLSNDEVFTPPELANQMLDTLASAWAMANDGESIWSNPNVKFLDPFTKSGVFLREVTKRLTAGLEQEIPDLERRVGHILADQVYGLGVTELTALLARRSVYCSKLANGEHSVAKSFDTPDGNIWFARTEHAWGQGRCSFCGARKVEYDRGLEYETHAYAFIHSNEIEERLNMIFGAQMQFDVIIGNPPYQLNDGGGRGSSASPIYHHFVNQAKAMDPRYICMVIPARWYSGGKGLDEFRAEMLNDKRLGYLADFPDSRHAFPDVDVAGGVCYFLWDRDVSGPCSVETFSHNKAYAAVRDLNEFPNFVRDSRALSVIHKVLNLSETSMSAVISSRKPFGIESADLGDPFGKLRLYKSRGDGKYRRSDVTKGTELIDKWKVLVSKTSSEHAGQAGADGTKRVLSRIEVMPPGSVCTESYLVVGPFESESQASSAASYLRTKFARYLLSSILLSQNISKGMFDFVPVQRFAKQWVDADLYEKYGLNDEEIELIDQSIRSIEIAENADD